MSLGLCIENLINLVLSYLLLIHHSLVFPWSPISPPLSLCTRSHSLAHRPPPAARTRVCWQPYGSILSRPRSTPNRSFLITPSSSIIDFDDVLVCGMPQRGIGQTDISVSRTPPPPSALPIGKAIVTDKLLSKKPKAPSAPLPPLPPLPLPPLCPHRTFLASLIVASKFTWDRCFSNNAWAELSELPPREIGRCEWVLSDALE
jgi:hypothetical protein